MISAISGGEPSPASAEDIGSVAAFDQPLPSAHHHWQVPFGLLQRTTCIPPPRTTCMALQTPTCATPARLAPSRALPPTPGRQEEHQEPLPEWARHEFMRYPVVHAAPSAKRRSPTSGGRRWSALAGAPFPWRPARRCAGTAISSTSPMFSKPGRRSPGTRSGARPCPSRRPAEPGSPASAGDP